MAIPMDKENGTEALLQRSARVALVMTVALVALAAIYYTALYMLAQ
jgi:hypothetical protein